MNPYCGHDPILRMQRDRRSMLFFAKAPSDTLRHDMLAPAARRNYRQARESAMAPVLLPSDRAHLQPSPETCAYMNGLVRDFKSIFGGV